MNLLKKYIVVFAVIFPVLILVLLRSLNSNHFDTDAKKLAEPSLKMANLVSFENLGSVAGEKLIINLGEKSDDLNKLSDKTLDIPAQDILKKINLNIIRRNKGVVILYSVDPAISVRIWMVLSQMGYKNILILTKDSDNEVLKYKNFI